MGRFSKKQYKSGQDALTTKQVKRAFTDFLKSTREGYDSISRLNWIEERRP